MKISVISVVILTGCVLSIGVTAHPQVNVQIIPPNPTSQDLISIRISGTWGNSCVPQDPQVSIENHHITIATSNPSEVCLMVLMPFELKVDIGKLPAGTYKVTVTYQARYPIEIGRINFKVEGEEVKLRGTVVDQEHQVGGGWWEVKVEDVLFGPEIIGDVAKVHYGVYPECFPYSIDPDIAVGDRVEVFGKYEVPICEPPEVSLCNSGYIIKFPPEPIDWEESGIFPNPVTANNTTLYIDGYVSSVTLLIFDLAGQKVVEGTYSTNSATVDLSDLDNGIYLYVLIAEKDQDTSKSPVKKLLVQR